jgi:hypothetical protein
MIADELRRVANQKPFKPFRVRLTSGETLQISRSMRTMVTDDRVIFGADADSGNEAVTRLRMVPLGDIAAVELTTAA